LKRHKMEPENSITSSMEMRETTDDHSFRRYS
jgi:hypothetical protein